MKGHDAMKPAFRTIVLILAILFVLSLPLYIPSGAMLDSQRDLMLDAMPGEEDDLFLDEYLDSQDELGLLRLLIPSASAEEAPTLTPLPMDFTPGRAPNAALFAEDGYQDSSITLHLETRQEEGVVWRLAFVKISDPSQLRTATAGKPGSSSVARVSSMAEKNNAVIAINANYYANDPVKTSFEFRMGEKIRAKFNRRKDLLITDENADLHVFQRSQKDEVEAFLADGHKIINAFTFGPALIKDGEKLQLDPEYGYNPKGREPRMAIGQLDKLSYVLVLAEGRVENSTGVTHQELQDFMAGLSCHQAFNFDGGNSAVMVYNGGYYQQRSASNERSQSDMLYFATLIEGAAQ